MMARGNGGGSGGGKGGASGGEAVVVAAEALPVRAWRELA